MKKYRAISLLLAASTLLLILVWLATGDKRPSYTKGPGKSVMKGVEVVYYKKERPDWRAEIKEALFSRDESKSALKDVNIFYFRADVSLHSKLGFYDIATGQLRLAGMVNGKGKGFTFKSPELLYLPSEDILATSKGLVIKGKKYMLSGRNGIIKDSQVMEVTGDVRAVFY
ncbi:hypothetical protein MNBD_NITROSPIRAE03-1370 [hydrothermal vent metagenome]|uniref:LPS export ABC transporter periplasmic protein LptC n=1 Tax=hydrothermal vent metagenome TaxID=652676 RepID=A0A3B1D5P7_9ZZZZ